MFRYEIGATILVKKYGHTTPVHVKILAKAPNTIKVEVLDDSWFRKGQIQILTADDWFTIGRMVS